MIRAAICLTLAASPVAAEGLEMSPEARAAFGAEIRALLLDDPGIVANALDRGRAPDAATIYAEEAASDKAMLSEEAEALFAVTSTGFGAAEPETVLAIFVAADCPDCARAVEEAAAIAANRPRLRVELRAADSSAATAARVAELAKLAGAANPVPPQNRGDADRFERLGLDAVPAYVLPDMMLRGWIPATVLGRYLD